MSDTAPPAILGELPAGDSPTLKLIPATPAQVRICWRLNASEWRGPLTENAYVRREQYLSTLALTRDGGVTWWVLVDSTEQCRDPVILAACETYRKTAFVAEDDWSSREPVEIQEVVSHSIGSVYCRDSFRGRGYAGRMMDELRKNLETWQQPLGQTARFNVLYSDIGKSFYAKRGWVPFPSNYVSLRPQSSPGPGWYLPQTRPVQVADLEELCAADETQLKRSMVEFGDSEKKTRIAFRPDADVLAWHHGREEFIGKELGRFDLGIKGAVEGFEPGERTWCIWTRKFHRDPAQSILYVVRIATEVGDAGFEPVGVVGVIDDPSIDDEPSSEQVNAVAACLKAAQEEAARLQLGQVEIWNPSATTLRAAQLLEAGIEVIDREEDSIASLHWYGISNIEDYVEWVGNEKYGWC